LNPEKINREWKKVESVDELAVRPVVRLTAKNASLRYEPETAA
jgi:hypothetical protein